MSDISNLNDTIVPKSDQLNADQLVSGPMTITVTSVRRGTDDQPVIVGYSGDEGRPYKPCKTMRKALIFAWGEDGREWIGKTMTLHNDPSVKFGGVKVGGIRISHLSHVQRDIALSLNTTRGKKEEFIIRKLEVWTPDSWIEKIIQCATMDELQSAFQKAIAECKTNGTADDKNMLIAAKDAQKQKLSA